VQQTPTKDMIISVDYIHIQQRRHFVFIHVSNDVYLFCVQPKNRLTISILLITVGSPFYDSDTTFN
jgi:hypothetical protein